MSRQIIHWKSLYAGDIDVVILGDSNLCADRWERDDYVKKELATMAQSSQQLVTGTTRIELVGQTVQKSCIDTATLMLERRSLDLLLKQSVIVIILESEY